MKCTKCGVDDEVLRMVNGEVVMSEWASKEEVKRSAEKLFKRIHDLEDQLLICQMDREDLEDRIDNTY